MLIGFTGEAGHGKDTAARFILNYAEKAGLRARRDAFADRLKVSAARALGYHGTTEQCIDFCNQLKQPGQFVQVGPLNMARTTISGREYLQYYGTEAHRQVFSDDFWIDQVLDRYFEDDGETLLVTDVRFDNEAEAVRRKGGVIWEIFMPSKGKMRESGHASESGISRDLIDLTFVNDQDLNHLEQLVLAAFMRLYYPAEAV